jgi:hypothetical protein
VFDADDCNRQPKRYSQKNIIGGIDAMNCFVPLSCFMVPQPDTAIGRNNKETHISHRTWLFPLYLLLFNIFVFPIAGAQISFEGKDTIR